MPDFQIELAQRPPPNPDGIVSLSMSVGDVSFTHLLRSAENAETYALRVPVAPLAFWFADNWWRLRWEPRGVVTTDSWRMAHEMTAIGHGHAWPNLTIWGDRDRVILVSRADPPGLVGPARFLTNAVTFVQADGLEQSIDGFLGRAIQLAPQATREPLRALIDALNTERQDPETTAWRRLEAITGHDPDQAPEPHIENLLEMEKDYRPADVEEAIAGFGKPDPATTLKDAIAQARRGAKANFSDAVNAASSVVAAQDRQIPWAAAEAAASAVRASWNRATGPLRNKALADIARIAASDLTSREGTTALPYALRVAGSGTGAHVMLAARWSHDRRFQLARAIGDAVLTDNSSLGAITGTDTSRQKFQRAFAAALLCPPDSLWEYLGTTKPTDSDIGEAARYFHVNERTVRTVLVNKNLIDRRRLNQPLIDPLDASQIDVVAEAA